MDERPGLGSTAHHRNDSRERRDSRRRRDRERDSDRSHHRRDRERRRSRSRSRESERYRDRDSRRSIEDPTDGTYNNYEEQRRHSSSFREVDSESRDTSNIKDGRTGMPPKRNRDDWRQKLRSIRDAHFNRSKQPSSVAQNQFTNDGSFMEMFKQKMASQSNDGSSVMPNSLVLASSSIKYDSTISLPPLTTSLPNQTTASTSAAEQDIDGVPIPAKKAIPAPLPPVGRRRNVKALKTGVVFKKTKDSEEDEASQEKLDAWARYLQEVQKYKRDNCVEEDSSRPLVK